jgi:hypothetical protein
MVFTMSIFVSQKLRSFSGRPGRFFLVSALISFLLLTSAQISQAEGMATQFPKDKIESVLIDAGKSALLKKMPPKGWTKSTMDPAKVLAAFAPLRLKKGYLLRAYQFSEGLNGNGFVWAMPENVPFPAPDSCPRVSTHFLNPPKPVEALDDVMKALEGDGSPWSYLLASLFQREIGEFGAIWHGASGWSTQKLLYDNFFAPDSDQEKSTTNRVGWKWLASVPQQWAPQVIMEKDTVTVTFYTYSSYEQQRIYCHTDTFKPGSYTFTTESKVIATGLSGYVY